MAVTCDDAAHCAHRFILAEVMPRLCFKLGLGRCGLLGKLFVNSLNRRFGAVHKLVEIEVLLRLFTTSARCRNKFLDYAFNNSREMLKQFVSVEDQNDLGK